ncbi:MAG: snRNA-activating protein of 50kDa MW C terminal-domain-containing protein [Benniella sp.]|nr:MAG: snRNA-activating protein of 50kDa MW C terminal-domain-containing protein [Benniella sp.]
MGFIPGGMELNYVWYNRLFSHQHDDLNRNSYPFQTFQERTPKRRCQMCNANLASYVTVNDRLAGHSPCYFCEDCYVAFHYNVEGNILYDDFQVFNCNTDT